MNSTNQSKPAEAVIMDKKATDRAINLWVLKFLFGPASLLSISAFVLGYWFPETIATVQPIAQNLGLHHLVALRTVGAEFNSAVYFYWLTFWLTLPLNLVWLYRVGIKQKLPTVLRAIAQANLNSGVWNEKSYTLKAGRFRFLLCLLVTVSLFIVQLVTAHEPSYCKGCETTSVMGFLLINWLGIHLILIATYFACSYLIFWKSIHTTFGAKNE